MIGDGIYLVFILVKREGRGRVTKWLHDSNPMPKSVAHSGLLPLQNRFDRAGPDVGDCPAPGAIDVGDGTERAGVRPAES